MQRFKLNDAFICVGQNNSWTQMLGSCWVQDLLEHLPENPVEQLLLLSFQVWVAIGVIGEKNVDGKWPTLAQSNLRNGVDGSFKQAQVNIFPNNIKWSSIHLAHEIIP